MFDTQVFWYGERGIVNAVIAHLARGNALTEGMSSILRSITWADEQPPSWLADILHVNLVVEVGLADFGDPDLIIVCETSEGKKLVFVEAKVVSYTDSMQSTSASIGTRWGMMQPGFNSSINGQLTLKYRFAKALSCWDGEAVAIAESAQMFDAYQQKLNDSLSKAPGRSLSKPSILKHVFKRLGLAGMPETQCHYVALTWDRHDNPFFSSSEVASNYLPIFLDEGARDVFHEMRGRIGWIGYRELHRALDLANSPEYMAAFRTMRDSDAPPQSFYSEKRKGRWETFPSWVVRLAEEVAECFGGQAHRFPGSFSVQDENKQTVCKIIPTGDAVFLGIRIGYQPFIEVERSITSVQRSEKRGVQRVTFVGLNFKTIEDVKDFITEINRHLSQGTQPAQTEVSEAES
jgi:hypothetical protein